VKDELRIASLRFYAVDFITRVTVGISKYHLRRW